MVQESNSSLRWSVNTPTGGKLVACSEDKSLLLTACPSLVSSYLTNGFIAKGRGGDNYRFLKNI